MSDDDEGDREAMRAVRMLERIFKDQGRSRADAKALAAKVRSAKWAFPKLEKRQKGKADDAEN